ncbi:MAG: menaquinone biosynthesis protein [Bacillota bacterium]
MAGVENWAGAAAALARSPEAEAVWRLGPVRLGYIDYLNTLPVYYGIEKGIIDLPVAIKKGVPAELNRLFLAGGLDITPISSIEFARHADQCILLPDLSISADGRVGSIFLFTRKPIREVRRVALTSHSATSVVLTRILLRELYGVEPEYLTMDPDLGAMLAVADAALIIGDAAIITAYLVAQGEYPGVEALDLGAEWKRLTGYPMVYALWVIRRDFADRSPDGIRLVARLLQESQAYAWSRPQELIAEGVRRRGLPEPVVAEYFQLIRHEFGPRYREGLRIFLEYAQRLGELDRVPELVVWGE